MGDEEKKKNEENKQSSEQTENQESKDQSNDTKVNDEVKEKSEDENDEPKQEEGPVIYTVRTTANREDQVVDFLSANAKKKKLDVYSVIRPHGLRSYIFIETSNKLEAEQAVFEVPYARGVLADAVPYNEIEHMIETAKQEINIQKGDIAEIISGPFKREKCKITKFDKDKEEVVVELLESAVPIPITLKVDALKVIRRDTEEE